MPRLLSLNVGLPRDVAWQGRTVRTAIWKEPVKGRRMARRLNIDGDGQGDLAGHGGEHRAVFVYQIESYRGMSSNRIHTEFFQAGPSLTPGIAATLRNPPHLPTAPAGLGPLVSFARSGLDVRWDPRFQSLLELAEACDVPVRWSCRTGVCHNCETALIAGAVSYQLDPVDPPAADNVLICCSQPDADVVIDL